MRTESSWGCNTIMKLRVNRMWWKCNQTDSIIPYKKFTWSHGNAKVWKLNRQWGNRSQNWKQGNEKHWKPSLETKKTAVPDIIRADHFREHIQKQWGIQISKKEKFYVINWADNLDTKQIRNRKVRHLDNVGDGGHTRKAKLKLGRKQFIEHQQQGVWNSQCEVVDRI